MDQLQEKKVLSQDRRMTPINILKAQGRQRRQVIFEVPSPSEIEGREPSAQATPNVTQTPLASSLRISEERK